MLRFLISENGSPASINSCLRFARENARAIRDVIPREVWVHINTLYFYSREKTPLALTKRGRGEFLEHIINQCQTITGVLSGTMNHDAGYTILKIGRNLERADMTSRIIDTRSANLISDGAPTKTTFDNLQWMSVLKSLTGYQMYRREMQVKITREDVLHFLMYSNVFPRALSHCVNQVEYCVKLLPKPQPVLLAIGQAREQLEAADVEKLRLDSLQQFIDELQISLSGVHDALASTYFGAGSEAATASA